MSIVFADRSISEPCRVLLLLMSTRMTDAGRVSVPRDELAELLNIAPRRVTARIREAIEGELLSKRGGGFNGRTAEYEALVKVAAQRPPSAAQGGGSASTFSVHLQHGESGLKVAAQRPPIARVTTESRTSDDLEHDDRDSLQSLASKDGSDEHAPSNSPLAAARPWQRLEPYQPNGATA